jgi:hypothetical protein
VGFFDTSAIIDALVQARLRGTLREFSGISWGCAIVGGSSKFTSPQSGIIMTIGVTLSVASLASYVYRLYQSHEHS